MKLRQLEYFVSVAEFGSFLRASAAMGITQPAVSRQIGALERDLKLRLFYRNGRGVALTDAGKRFLSYAKGIMRQIEGARDAVASDPADVAGKVVVGLPPSLGEVLTLPLVRAFRERFRNAELGIMEALSIPLQERLLGGRIDLAVLHNPAPSPLLVIEPMMTEKLCLLSAAHDARPGPLSFSALEQFDLILPDSPHPIRTLLEAEAARRGVRLKMALEIDAIAMILQLVAEGYGHSVVPYSVVRAGMSRDGLVARPIVRPTLDSMVALVTPARRPRTAAADGVADILRAELRRLAALKGPFAGEASPSRSRNAPRSRGATRRAPRAG